MGQQPLQLAVPQTLLLQFLPRLFLRLAHHQRLGLGEEVRQQQFVVYTVADGVVRLRGSYEIARYQARTLVDELIEGVLAVGAGLAPHDRTRLVVDGPARSRDVLAVALHVALLEIRGEPVQVLVVRQEAVGFRSVKISVPYT